MKRITVRNLSKAGNRDQNGPLFPKSWFTLELSQETSPEEAAHPIAPICFAELKSAAWDGGVFVFLAEEEKGRKKIKAEHLVLII